MESFDSLAETRASSREYARKKANGEPLTFFNWWRRRELAILASQRACMRVVVHRLAAVLLEFPVHPASVPDADSISRVS